MALSSAQLRSRRRRQHRLADIQARFVRRRSVSPAAFLQYPPYQTPAEEWVNGLTHGVAALAGLAGGIWLVLAAGRRGNAGMTLGCAAYAVSLVATFSMSALSHWVKPPRLRALFRTLDQAAIYLLIAGSATPFLIRYLLPGGWNWLLPALWGLALAGAWNKLRGDRVNSISVVSYVALAWFPVIAARPLMAVMPPGCMTLVSAMGACYMLGVAFLVSDGRFRYFHAVWHVLVVAASACTCAAIARYVI